ncbi:hypothetical protein BCR32DRAFT_265884 [Anaeromyces robustus]|uniref:Uncharacterized protein n=1 Tax=Anaeromyces robustus TaxID=1754192 RepID=A0A1Y1XIE6_9FUNG|nr:hypothetical protein BCR32DRAFT_273585 [Anaeromyces robustus]ORX85134.1 hypothetical protein BCR32DRAFT_265884 [Anaeromyces robustus]|eukprot:ORX52066.1 hypothetical protein BCR32DRAFT_273585 [Anaeromyces robustus]
MTIIIENKKYHPSDLKYHSLKSLKKHDYKNFEKIYDISSSSVVNENFDKDNTTSTATMSLNNYNKNKSLLLNNTTSSTLSNNVDNLNVNNFLSIPIEPSNASETNNADSLPFSSSSSLSTYSKTILNKRLTTEPLVIDTDLTNSSNSIKNCIDALNTGEIIDKVEDTVEEIGHMQNCSCEQCLTKHYNLRHSSYKLGNKIPSLTKSIYNNKNRQSTRFKYNIFDSLFFENNKNNIINNSNSDDNTNNNFVHNHNYIQNHSQSQIQNQNHSHNNQNIPIRTISLPNDHLPYHYHINQEVPSTKAGTSSGACNDDNNIVKPKVYLL